MTNAPLPTGKLDVQILRRMLQRYTLIDERVLLGPGIGEDAAVLDMGEKVLVVTTDPITFATDEIGYYAVMVNANDIAATGAEPKWFSVCILLPEKGSSEALVEKVFQQIHGACKKLKISLIGGHTEITHGLDRPVLVGQMIGEGKKNALITTGGAKPGDWVLLSKGLCVEGTSVIAREKEQELLSRGIPMDLLNRARRFLFDPGIGVLEESRLALRAGGVHAMHDVTEGGLANGLHELSTAAGVEIQVDLDRIPLFEESRLLCQVLDLNPLGLIASGSLLLTASPKDAEKILGMARQEGLTITRIGHIISTGGPSVTLRTSSGYKPMPYFGRDEVAKIF